ncbi:MAG: hypothetical protein ACE5HT_01580 [Gemmatimonadales bacterium]
MKRLITAAFLIGMIGPLVNPKPADAQDGKLKKCLQEAVYSCDQDFQGNEPETIAIRGWCYMIRGAICRVF